MAYRTYMRYHQNADVYSRSVTTNNAGQRIASWALSKSNVPCAFQPVSAERRVSPYVDNVEEYEILVPHSYANYFDYGYRVQDIEDRYGNSLRPGPFEVVEISRRTGFNGKLSHILVRLRQVVEVGS
jgi:hypothetical protein